MNTSAPLFAEQNLETEINQQLEEMYCRLYALAAEDFTTVADVDRYIKALTQWTRLLQQSLSSVLSIIANHTHVIPPHTHPILPHTHTIASATSGMTDPNAMSLSTQPMQLQTNIPMEQATIKWDEIRAPSYNNSTNTIPNMTGNMVVEGPSLKGPLVFGPRRAKTPMGLAQPTVLPLVKGMVDV